MSSSAITFESPSNSPPPAAGPPATGVPKFKSFPPSSLPISPPAFSPSSYFSIPGGLTSADLLDSPVLLSSSHNLPSPTTGSFTFNFNINNQNQEQGIKLEQSNFTDFQFRTHSNSPTEIYQQPRIEDDRNSEKTDYPLQRQSFGLNHANYNHQSSQKKLVDGYNWRKYGQKSVKGSDNPRSYYKCTYRNCSMRKKVESSLDGEITQIVYKGNHNHPKPQSIKRSYSSSGSNNSVLAHQFDDFPDQSLGSGQWDFVGKSSVSIGDVEFDPRRSRGDEFLDNEIHAKKLKESENEGISPEGCRIQTLREPRVVIQTTSDIDVLDDGYRWRKYGQKVVKGNHNPRSYYKCSTLGCSVRKHIERASHDLKSVLTTYEGKHNHNVPAARGVGHRPSLPINPSNDMIDMTIDPLELYHHHPRNFMINPIRGSRLSPLSQSSGGFGFSSFENPIQSTFVNQQSSTENIFSDANDESKDQNFLESLLH